DRGGPRGEGSVSREAQAAVQQVQEVPVTNVTRPEAGASAAPRAEADASAWRRARPQDGSRLWRAWLVAIRPATLVVGVAPVFVGTACAAALGHVAAGPFAAALAGALLLQIGSNLANDVFDHEKGADGADRLGPTRAVASGLLTGAQVRAGMVVVFGLALLCGVYLTAVAPPAPAPAIALVGLAPIAAAILSPAGPWPLGYHGLGDAFVLLFFGFVAVCGSAFVQLGRVPALAVVAAIPVGALAAAVLVVNNL